MAVARPTVKLAAKPAAKAPVKAAPQASRHEAASEPLEGSLAADQPALDVLFATPDKAAEVLKEQVLEAREIGRRLTQGFMDQTRDNYAQMKKVSEDATAAAQKSFETAAGSFNSIRLRQIEFAQQQANAGFELVKSLSGLDNPSQAVEVTAQFWTQQAEAAAVIQKDMAQLWRKMAEDCALPFRGSINLDPFGMARRAS